MLERSITEQQLTERGAPKTFPGQNNNAKSYKCPGKPCAPETNGEQGEGLPRPSLKTFSVRQRRGHEGAGLGVSRPQNPEAHISVSLDPTSQRRRTRKRHDLQPPGRRTESCRYRTGPQNSRRSRGHRRSRIQIDYRSSEERAGRQSEIEKESGVIRKSRLVNRDSISRSNDSRNPCTRWNNCAMTRCARLKLRATRNRSKASG